MSTSTKRTSSFGADENLSPVLFPKSPMSRPAKQARLDTSLDIHALGPLSSTTDTNVGADQERYRANSITTVGDDVDNASLSVLKAKIKDLETKLLQKYALGSNDFSPFPNGDMDHIDEITEAITKEPAVQRRPAKPLLNRVSWVAFKNLYLDEEVYAVDVLMGSPKFYWQQRSDEREIKDRMEAAKGYNAKVKEKTQEKAKERSLAKAAQLEGDSVAQLLPRKEMPERIRINSQPVLAILADITGEKWGGAPKVLLRPYKLLVAYEKQIQERLDFLKKLWSKRPKPEDVTTSASAVTTYEPETLEDDDVNLYEDNYYPGQQDDAFSILSHEQKIKRKIDLTTTYDALQDLTCLVEFMDKDLLPVVKQYMPESTHGNIYFRDLWYLYQPGDWVILDERRGKRFSPDAGPGDERPSSQPGNLGDRAATIWRVLETAGGRPKLSAPNKYERNRPPSSEVSPFCVRCYRLDYDGDRFGPIWVDFDFQPWQGERRIEQLDIVPMRLTKDATEKRDRYVKRGKQFMDLTTPQHRVYSGPFLNFHPSGLLFEHVSTGQHNVYGSVIVDFKETARMYPKMVMKLGLSKIEMPDDDLTMTEHYPVYIWEDRKGGTWKEGIDEIYNDVHIDAHQQHKHIRQDHFMSRWYNLSQGDHIHGSEFGDNEFALLPNRVCAYILQRRRFAILKLDCLRPQGPDPQNWNDLFLDRDNKETVKAQTMSHFRNKRLRAVHPDLDFDLNREKGLGLIILLHGVPGVGKTSTAECVAQLLGKPLFPITCGDLGTSAEQVEQQLYEIFGKAEKWDCVLLLDEADVFLSARGKNDLKRNAVVSIFLRILEFYTGILFLTTNRIGVLDEAFMSRIHTQLYYPPLEETQALKIWETNLRKLQRRKCDTMEVNRDHILQFARDHFENNVEKSTRWNGRQIRNACQAAAALAEHEAFGSNDGIHTPEPGAPLPVARLEVRHFQKIDSTVREFHDYMTNVQGDDFSAVAKMKSERDDEYVSSRRHQDHYNSHEHTLGQVAPPFPRSGAHPPDGGPTHYGGGYDNQRPVKFGPNEQHPTPRWGPYSRN